MRFVFVLLSALLAAAQAPEQAKAIDLGPPQTLAENALTTSFTSIEGKSVTLEDYQGQILVLNFWATWCGPCKREIPSVGRLQARFEGEPLKVLAIAVDRASPEKLKAFMTETDATNLTILRDTSMASMKSFALRGLPATFILDPSGRQLARHDGFDEWDRPEIIKALEELLDSVR